MPEPVKFGDSRLPQRYWDKVQPDPGTGCWNWTATKYAKGYGRVGYAGRKNIGAHIWMSLVSNGPKPTDDAQALHSCDNPPCVNPDHIRWGTHAENMEDRQSRGRCRAGIRNAAKTHCPYGHPYNEANTGWDSSKTGARTCRACRAAQQRERRRREALKRAAAKGA